MERIISLFKSNLFHLLIIGSISFLPFGNLYAAKGCCSRHGGVAGCNNVTGFLMCKDGKQSPECKCSGTTVKSYQYKSPKSSKVPSTATMSIPTKTTKEKAKEKAKEKVSTRGCCKGHGGVKSCDKKSGYQRCKDGTLSSTCVCK